MAFLPSPCPPTQADKIAQACLTAYHPLEAKYKPKTRSNGVREWTVLAGIVLSRQDEDTFTCVSLSTGVKVLSERALPVHGDALHDSHAEVLARRGFVAFLIREGRKVVHGEKSVWVERSRRGMQLMSGLFVHLYVSTLPCGDASTLYTALSQDAETAALKSNDNAAGVPLSFQSSLTARGRSGYEVYGALRTKPGRADSIPSISHSCSDKIASWSVLGLQGALVAAIYPQPIYLESIVIGDIPPSVPEEVDMSRYFGSEASWRDIIRRECERAFWGRLSSIDSLLPAPYNLHKPPVNFTALSFLYGRWQVGPVSASSPFPSDPAATDMRGLLYVASIMEAPEPISNGCKGNAVCKLDRTVPVEPRFRSVACRLQLMRAVQDLQEADGVDEIQSTSYYDAKHASPASTYQQAKAIMRSSTGTDTPSPFAGWLVSGPKWQRFDKHGHVSTTRYVS